MGAYVFWDNNYVFFDVVTSETQEKSSIITEHPVETGANITDHVRPNLDTVTLEGFVTQTPINKFAQRVNSGSEAISRGAMQQIPLDVNPNGPPPGQSNLTALAGRAATAILSLTDPSVVANVLTFPDGHDFVGEVINVFETLRTQAILVTVVCPSWVYENMIVESVSINGDPGTGTGRSFSVTFKEIRTVSSSIVAAPLPTIPRAKPEKNNGTQEAKDPEEPKVSVAAALAKQFGGLGIF